MHERVGDRYALIRPLGRGGMGEVFLARDLHTGSECALKRLRPDAVSDRSALSREFALLAGFRHPAVVEVLELGYAPDGAAWYTMQFVPGSSADRLAPLHGEALAFVAAELVHGLEALHHAGIVHGDLKPSNVVVIPSTDPRFASAHGRPARPAGVRIVDFGLAHTLGGPSRRLAGTAGFAAPEVVEGGAITAASDLYALGATLYALATGRPPFDAETSTARLRRQSEGPASAGVLDEAGVPPALASLVLRLLSDAPSERPADAREVRLELQRIVAGARRPLAERLGTFVLVGRERELARLDLWIESGEPRVLTLVGEPGIGRTSLLDAFAAREVLARRPILRVGGDSRAVDQAITHGQSLATGDARPVLIVDDAERLPASAMARLRRLALDPDSALRMVWSCSALAAPSEEERVFAYSGRVARLGLKPLDRAGVERLVAARIGAPAPPELIDHLLGAADGHPGLSLELLRAAAAAGALVEDDEGVRVDAGRLSTLRLPGEFAAAQIERLRSLHAGAREAALALAVGGGVPRAKLERLVPEAGTAGIEALLESGLARWDDDVIRLSYASLGEALIEAAPPERVRALHRAAPDVLDPPAGARLAHLARGGDPDAALTLAAELWTSDPDQAPVAIAARIAEEHALPGADLWLERAAQAAWRRGRYADAARLFERAIDLTRDDGVRAERWERLAASWFRAGRLSDVERAIAAGRACDPSPRVRARLLGTEAARRYAAGDLNQALQAARESMAACAAAEDSEGEANAALTAGSILLALDRRDEATAMARHAAERYVACGQTLGQVRALQLQGMVVRRQGRADEARTIYQDALERARTGGSRLAIEEGWSKLAQLAADRGRWQEARAHLRQALRVALEDGQGRSAALATLNLAQIEGMMGRPREAVRRARRALRMARAFLPSHVSFAHRSLAQGLRGMGRLAGAQRAAERALGLALEQAHVEDLAWCRVEQCRALFERERYGEALGAAAHGRAEADWTPGHAVLELLAGRAALRLGDRKRAAQPLRSFREWQKRHDAPYAAALAAQLRAELSLAEGRVEEAVERLNAALEAYESFPAAHDRAMALLDGARLAHMVRSGRAPIGDWLRQAGASFGKLGNRRRRFQTIELENEWLRQVDHDMADADRGLLEKIGRLLHSLSNHQELTRRAMELAVEHFDAERGVLLFRDEATGAMEPIAQCGAEDATAAEEALRFSRQLVRRVVDEARSILVDDAPEDPLAASQSVTELRLRALLCVPMFLSDGRLVGAVYLDSRRPGAFGTADRRLLEGFAAYIASAFQESRATERLAIENLELRQEMGARARAGLIGSSPALQKVIHQVELAARSKAIVLLTGETGTGKGLVAEVIHRSSARASGPFVAINCAALEKDLAGSELFGIPEGVATGVTYGEGAFRAADKGTLFLDEITEMPWEQQGKLLKVLEEGKVAPVGRSAEPVPVDVRIIAATNKDLRALVDEGHFRHDLYYRLDVLRIHMPPLRDRKGDIAEMARHFATQIALRDDRPVPELSADFLASLAQSDWEGNVRGLRNHVERKVVQAKGNVVHAEAVAAEKASPRRSTNGTRKLKEEQDALERARLEQALRRHGGNQSRAAADLGLKESTFRSKLQKHKIASRRKLRFG